MGFKKADLLKVVGTRKIADARVGKYNSLDAVEVSLEDGTVGYFSKERFEQESIKWEEDADGTLLLPPNYRLAKSGYWTPFDRAGVGAGSFKLVGEA